MAPLVLIMFERTKKSITPVWIDLPITHPPDKELPVNNEEILNNRLVIATTKENYHIDALGISINRDNFWISNGFIPAKYYNYIEDDWHYKSESIDHDKSRRDVDDGVFELRMLGPVVNSYAALPGEVWVNVERNCHRENDGRVNPNRPVHVDSFIRDFDESLVIWANPPSYDLKGQISKQHRIWVNTSDVVLWKNCW